MKSYKLFAALVVLVSGAVPSLSFGQTNAYDDAYHYSHASATWAQLFQGTNSGFGFTAWFCATNGPRSHGFFTTHNTGTTPPPTISSPTNCCEAPGNNTNQHVWGVFANSSGTADKTLNTAVAYRGFSNSLTTSDVFKIQWQTIGIGNANTNLGGFVLRNGNSTNGVSDYRTGQRFSFYYVGGGSNSFVIWDGNGVTAIGVPFTQTGMNCEFSLKTADTYRFQVKSATTGNLIFLWDDQPLDGGGTVDSIALFAQQTDANQEFNRMQISSTTLVPPTIINAAPVNGIYINPGTSNVSFEVDSLASTVSTNTVTLLLNGVPQKLAANTTGSTNQLLATNVTALASNLTYTATIIAADANGNRSTNTFNFNTWRADLPFIEAEDYNYNSGGFIPNSLPNPFGAYGGNLLGSNGVDYLETDLSGTNNAYRPTDLPQIQPATDADHAGYADGAVPDYNLGYTQFGEWQNYTRVMTNTTYAVYARMAAFGGSATMSVSHLANPTATTSNQPNVSLGTCVAAHTGGSQVYDFTQLKDLFSNPVLIKFAGTNTFRCTVVGDNGSYNLSYLIFVPVTNATVLKPYLSFGYPYPGATGVALDSGISLSIANRETAVNPASIQVSLNGSNVTAGIVLSNNAAGSVVTYVLPNFLAPNVANTLTAIYSDTTGTNAPITNTWTFTTANSASVTLPANIALPVNAGTSPGFAERIYKIDDAAATTASIAVAEATLAGARTNPATSQPYPNLANGGPNADGSYSETNVINYDINAQSTGVFPGDKAFPYVPAAAVNNNIAMEALMYLQLTAGNHVLVVRSDDGFKLTAGPTPGDTNFLVGLFDGGRGNGTPSVCYVTAPVTGLYPMRLMYYQAGSGGNLEFYSLDGGNAVLINDTNAAAFKSFQTVAAPANPVTILNPARSGNTVSFSFLTQAAHTHYVEFKNQLTDANWNALRTISGSGSTTNVTDTTATNVTRFYRVRSQ
jgi:hypothetical protein